MSGPWEKYQQQGAAGAGPWLKYQQQPLGPAVPQPSPGQMDQDLANMPRPVEEPFDPMASMFGVQPSPAVPTGTTAERRDLRDRGIQVGNAPVAAQFKAGFGRNDLEAYRQQGYEVTIDPRSGRTLFRRSAQEPWSTVSEPGLPTLGDIAGLAGPAVREIPAALGAAGGAAVGALGGAPGALAGGAAGAGAGAGFGEAGRVAIGKRLGVVPESDTTGAFSIPEATMAGLLSIVGGLGYQAVKAYARRGMFPGIQDITEEQYLALREKARAQVAGTGAEDTLRPSQVFAAGDGAERNVADKLAAQEQRILSTGPADARDALASNMREQQGIVARSADGLQGEAPMLAPEQIGRNVGTAAGREVRQDYRSAVERVGNPGTARADALQSQRQTLEPATQPDYVGGPLRERIERAYETAEETASRGYQAARAMPGPNQGQAINTVALLKKDAEEINRILIPALNENDRQLVEPTIQRLVREVVVDDAGLPQRAVNPSIDTSFTANQFSGVSLEELDATLRAIRRQIRKVHTGVATTDVQQLMRLENALQKDRDIILGPQRAQALAQAEQGWRQLRDEFNRAPLIDRALSRKSGGAERVEDFQFGRLSLNPDNAKAIANVLRNDPEALEMMRSAMREKAREVSGLTAGRDLDPNALQAWVRKNEPMLSSVFSRQEIDNLVNPARMQREYQSQRAALDEVRKTVEQRFARYGVERDVVGKMKDPTGYVDSLLEGRNIDMARETMALLARRDKTTADEIRALARQRLYRDIAGEGGPSKDKIASLLGDESRMRVYREMLGPQFEQRVGQIASLIRTLNPEFIQAPVEGQKANVIRSLQRIFISPLTALSRRVTYLRGLSEDEIAGRIARAVVDDGEFRRLIRAAGESGWARPAAMGAGAAVGAEKGNEGTELGRKIVNGR